MPSPSEPLWTCFPALVGLGALLNLDKQVFGPFMVGRPLVTGLVMGLVTGEVNSGVWMGLSAELLWLAVLPLGGRITPNAGLAVSAAFISWRTGGFAAETGGGPVEATLVLSFLTVPLWAKALGAIDQAVRRLVPPVLARVRADLAQSLDPHFLRRNLYGLLLTLALAAAALAAAALINVQVIQAVIRLGPPALLLNLGFIFRLIPFMGLLGMAVFLEAKTFPYYLGGLLASLLALSAV